ERLTVLEASSGRTRWSAPAYLQDDVHLADVLLNRQVVYVVNYQGRITARRADTGAVLWQNDGPQPAHKYLVTVRDGVLYMLLDEPGQFVALSAATGHILWSVPGDVWAERAALVGATRDLLYFATGRFYQALDLRTGKQHWQRIVPEVAPQVGSVPLLAGQ